MVLQGRKKLFQKNEVVAKIIKHHSSFTLIQNEQYKHKPVPIWKNITGIIFSLSNTHLDFPCLCVCMCCLWIPRSLWAFNLTRPLFFLLKHTERFKVWQLGCNCPPCAFESESLQAFCMNKTAWNMRNISWSAATWCLHFQTSLFIKGFPMKHSHAWHLAAHPKCCEASPGRPGWWVSAQIVHIPSGYLI